MNDSYSGSRVTQIGNYNTTLFEHDSLFPSGCSELRTNNLYDENVNPNVIIINLGINDWVNHAPFMETGLLNCENYQLDQSYFNEAYVDMLIKLRKKIFTVTNMVLFFMFDNDGIQSII